MDNLTKQQEIVAAKEVAFNLKLQEALDERLSQERVKMQEQLSKNIKANLIQESTLQLKELQEEMESQIKADAQIELNKLIKQEKEKLQKEVLEATRMKLKAKDEQLEQIKKQLDDAQRKAEQGSMQIQGEAQHSQINMQLVVPKR